MRYSSHFTDLAAFEDALHPPLHEEHAAPAPRQWIAPKLDAEAIANGSPTPDAARDEGNDESRDEAKVNVCTPEE